MNPSRAQLRMLHVLARGTLVFKNWPYPKFELPTDYETDEAWQFHQVTARLIVERGWAELHKFDAQRGEYGITVYGLALAQQFCDCLGKSKKFRGQKVRFEEQTETLAGKVICKYCARLVKRKV
jgi:hypothetical protein